MRCLAIGLIVLIHSSCFAQEWFPPEAPDPSTILREARSDADAGRHEIALQKHVWYHNNALVHDRAQYGVRLSFALSNWKNLASKHPPALAKLKEVRGQAAKAVLAGISPKERFHEAAAIDRTLKDNNATVDLFLVLHKEKPETAGKVYHLAQRALIDAKQYGTCKSYIDSAKDMNEIVAWNKRVVPKMAGTENQDFFDKSFAYKATALVALLAVNDQPEEANSAAEIAKAARDNAEFNKAIDAAIQGTFPTPFP
jgi:hypothetical protein